MPAIDALMRPQIAAGRLLPRSVNAHAFLVATDGDMLLGAVALRHLTPRVAELCSLVAAQRGVGLGRQLVTALVTRARMLGYEEVIALTEATRFFERCDFATQDLSPWNLDCSRSSTPFQTALAEANELKSATCRRCTRRPRCGQTLVNLSLGRKAA